MSKLRKITKYLFILAFAGLICGCIAIAAVLFYYSRDLQDHKKLANYKPATVTRLYSTDGNLIEEFSKEKRFFVPINDIPQIIVQAFISAEDKNFYQHKGIDFQSLIRAMLTNISNLGSNKNFVGGSTITQQVVKNLLLTNERSLERKIKEAILSFRLTKEFSKDRIMEIYLNEIYLGDRAYGIAAASLNYFKKDINDLTIEDAAVLASLPKAPSRINPKRYYKRALGRRNWVIGRMVEEGFITQEQAEKAKDQPIALISENVNKLKQNSTSFAEAVRLKLTQIYSDTQVYENGLNVVITIDPTLQEHAINALRDGLMDYDKRHGFKGALTKLENLENIEDDLLNIEKPESAGDWQLAVVTKTAKEKINITTEQGVQGVINLENLQWARKYINDSEVGSEITRASNVLKEKDVIFVSEFDKEKYYEDQKYDDEEDAKAKKAHNDALKAKISEMADDLYNLEQIPEINGAIVAIEPQTGKILAMVGGFANDRANFNRATQAKRQPGSTFKPFVYLAALENGFDPNSIVVDEEVKLFIDKNRPSWNPKNHSHVYYGPTTLRVGVEKSRNAMTVRLAQLLGLDKIIEMAERVGVYNNPPAKYSMTLGSIETTLLDMTNAYAILANGGKQVYPSLIEYVQNRNGKIIYRRDKSQCESCLVDLQQPDLKTVYKPKIENSSAQIIDPIANYQITSILQGVIERGTGRRAKKIGKNIAGKTGTTNKTFDSWFVGYSPKLAVGVFAGFDQPRSLGNRESGATVALPIWTNFMQKALENQPNYPFTTPQGVKLIRIDAKTGLLPTSLTEDKYKIYEAFREGTEPTRGYGITLPENDDENYDDNFDDAVDEFEEIGIY